MQPFSQGSTSPSSKSSPLFRFPVRRGSSSSSSDAGSTVSSILERTRSSSASSVSSSDSDYEAKELALKGDIMSNW